MPEPTAVLLATVDRSPMYLTIHHPVHQNNPQWGLEWMGLIPSWLSLKAKGESMRDCCKRSYPFGWNTMDGFSVLNDVLLYPEDEPLDPIVELHTDDGERMISYTHAIFRFVGGDDEVIVRMD